jgi:hypothetical protein
VRKKWGRALVRRPALNLRGDSEEGCRAGLEEMKANRLYIRFL